MQGDQRILEFLNEQLTAELTAINQYFLHAKMQESWGLAELAGHTRAAALEEMRHAEAIIDRILQLDGLPNYQRLFAVRIGEVVGKQLEYDLLIAQESVGRLRRAGEHARSIDDSASAQLFSELGTAAARRADRLESQRRLAGEPGYAGLVGSAG